MWPDHVAGASPAMDAFLQSIEAGPPMPLDEEAEALRTN